ncbi:MAG: 30S ribosomal protein S6 [Acidimicrobiia bacterium]|nr:MAG: 30S ribosomal protein S6 [Acidimicrobiia bacterium]
MRSYELTIIHRPDMAETDVQKQVEEVSATIDTSGKVTGSDFWGKRRFAYEIDHMNEGYYSVLDFEGDVNLVEALDRALGLSDAVVRHKVLRRVDREG